MVAAQHLPDRVAELAGEVGLRDLWAALAAEPPAGALVALAEAGCEDAAIAASISPQRRYLGPCLDSGPRQSISPDWLTRTQAGVAGQLDR